MLEPPSAYQGCSTKIYNTTFAPLYRTVEGFPNITEY